MILSTDSYKQVSYLKKVWLVSQGTRVYTSNMSQIPNILLLFFTDYFYFLFASILEIISAVLLLEFVNDITLSRLRSECTILFLNFCYTFL